MWSFSVGRKSTGWLRVSQSGFSLDADAFQSLDGKDGVCGALAEWGSERESNDLRGREGLLHPVLKEEVFLPIGA